MFQYLTRLLAKFEVPAEDVSLLLNNAWFIFNPEQGKASQIDMNLEPLFSKTLRDVMMSQWEDFFWRERFEVGIFIGVI